MMGRIVENLFAPVRWICAFGLANAAAWVAWLIHKADFAEADQDVVRSAIAALFAAGAVGLARQVRWGYRFALVSIWLLVLSWVGAMASMANRADVRVDNPIERLPAYAVVGIVLAGVIALFVLYFVLQQNKGRFRPAWW